MVLELAVMHVTYTLYENLLYKILFPLLSSIYDTETIKNDEGFLIQSNTSIPNVTIKWCIVFFFKIYIQIPKSDDIDLKNPTDMSYVFIGAYTPLSCKLVEQVGKNWILVLAETLN